MLTAKRLFRAKATTKAPILVCVPSIAGTAAALTFGIAFFMPTIGWAQAGHLDPTFARGGIFVTQDSQAFDTLADAVTVQSDGKIVVGGEIGSLAGVLRLTTNGTPDSSFGTNGVATINVPSGLGGGVQVIGVAVQTDGKIVAGISTINSDGSESFSLARLNTNGAPDEAFGTSGLVTTLPFGLQLSPTVLALQSDGKILLAGDGVLVRYDTNGQPDAAFGSGGFAVLTARPVTAIALQTNGEILIAAGGPPLNTFPPSFEGLSVTGLISRYNSNGSLDTSFGESGQAASAVTISAIEVQSDGKIVVAGAIESKLVAPPSGNHTGFGLGRFTSSGNIDTTFGKHGLVVTDFGASAPFAAPFALALQSNGDILAAGVAEQPAAIAGQTTPSGFALARYTATGQLDPTFGSAGKVTTAFGTNRAAIIALVLQSDGKIVTAGNSGGGTQSLVNNIAIARYLSN
jgi:uncharacterized delta-60 repeat protein